ncbi:MAG: PaaI family thioesterase [Burkholderiaceae bacterium]|nr:PaaI family thioesterase [Burkholderiaceae bacterium]
MQELAPEVRAAVERGYLDAAFVTDVGIKLLDCGPGWCEAGLTLLPRHMQHSGVVHGGVQSTLADHTAGSAAFTMIPAGHYILTAEFKLSLLRPAKGSALWCRGTVLKPGKTIFMVEAEVYAEENGERRLTSKLSATMIVMQHVSKS